MNYLPPVEFENECLNCGEYCEREMCSKKCAEDYINER